MPSSSSQPSAAAAAAVDYAIYVCNRSEEERLLLLLGEGFQQLFVLGFAIKYASEGIFLSSQLHFQYRSEAIETTSPDLTLLCSLSTPLWPSRQPISVTDGLHKNQGLGSGGGGRER